MVDPRDQHSNPIVKKGHQSSTPSAWEPEGWGRIKIRRYSPGARGLPHQLVKLGKPSRALLSFLSSMKSTLWSLLPIPKLLTDEREGLSSLLKVLSIIHTLDDRVSSL